MNKYVKSDDSTNHSYITPNKIYKVAYEYDTTYCIYNNCFTKAIYDKKYFTNMNNIEKVLYT